VTQAKRNPHHRLRIIISFSVTAALLISVLSLIAAGCRHYYYIGTENRPGRATCVYWIWDGFDREAALQAAPPETGRWAEFLRASRSHGVLIHDFQFLEGHPEVVEPRWQEAAAPKVTEAGWVGYRSAGRWHAVHRHLAPGALSLFFLRLPDGRRIDNGDREAWRFPVGTEIVQMLYRHRRGAAYEDPGSDIARKAVLVEWRRMRMAGHRRGQLRTDGTRSGWVYESAVRDPAASTWRRTREDGHDIKWVRMGRPGRRFRWPVIRGHTCAECHSMAGQSPLDGPRGGNEVYSIGDLQEIAWSGQSEWFAPLLRYSLGRADLDAARRRPRPIDPVARRDAYVHALALERNQNILRTRVQQMTLDHSPFNAGNQDAAGRGKEIYMTQCAACHGLKARGRGRLALRNPAPPAIAEAKPKRIIKALREGRRNMPSLARTLPGDEQWRLVEYLQTLKR